MVRQILIAVLLGLPVVLASCSGAGGGTPTPGITPEKPLIDSRTPASVETATFALG